MKDVIEAIRERRSIKSFKDRPVAEGDIDALLELAVRAPNHRMTGPWGFVVMGPGGRGAYGEALGNRRARKVEDPDAAAAVLQKTVEGAVAVPAMIAFTQRLSDDPEIREEDYASVFMGIQNVCLAAPSLGLGTHIKTGAVLGEESLRRALGVADGERVVALVQLGEPEEIPSEKPREAAGTRTRRVP